MSRRFTQLTREQILDCFQWMSFGRPLGREGDFSYREFHRQTGICHRQIARHFGTWSNLRREMGLEPRAKRKNSYSLDELFEKYHEVVLKVGRPATFHEIGRWCEVTPATLRTRIGNRPELDRAYEAWLRRREDPAPRRPAAGDNPPRSHDWLRNRWFGLRVGFEIRSSDYKGREVDGLDALIVLEHNWPACPVRVVELQEALPEPPFA